MGRKTTDGRTDGFVNSRNGRKTGNGERSTFLKIPKNLRNTDGQNDKEKKNIWHFFFDPPPGIGSIICIDKTDMVNQSSSIQKYCPHIQQMHYFPALLLSSSFSSSSSSSSLSYISKRIYILI